MHFLILIRFVLILKDQILEKIIIYRFSILHKMGHMNMSIFDIITQAAKQQIAFG